MECFKRIGKRALAIIMTILLFFSIVGSALIKWYSDTFGVTIREILYTIKSPLKGADTHFLEKAVVFCVPSFGRGCMQAYYRLIYYAENYVEYATQIGPVENTFVSLLYDYGVIGGVLYLGVFIRAFIAMFNKRANILSRKQAVLVVAVMFMSAFVDMEYWPNMAFILFTSIGCFLGMSNVKAIENK